MNHEPTCICILLLDNTYLSINRHVAKSPLLRYVVVKELSSMLVVGRKSQFFFLQKKVGGQAELLGSEEEGWMRESMADRCLQRPDSTSVTIRWKKDFTAATKTHGSLHLHCDEHVVNTPLYCGINTGLPCQPVRLLPYPDGLGASH